MRSGTTLNDLMQWNNTIFDGITLDSRIDHGTLVSSIMLRCGLQNPLYEHWDVFKSQVSIWFAAHEWNFKKLCDLIEIEYNPLWNKDGTVKITRELDRAEDETLDTERGGKNQSDTTFKKGETETLSGTDTTAGTTNQTVTDDKTVTNNATDVKSVKAFNATDWMDTDKNVHSGTEVTDDDEVTTRSDNETTTYGRTTTLGGQNEENKIDTFGETGKNVKDNDVKEKETTTTVEQGNIGVTMSQQMFLSEVDLLDGFNLYDWIAKKFDDDLMIGVYTY